MSRPITYLRCNVCGEPRPRSQFNRTKSACLLCVQGKTENAQTMFAAIGRNIQNRAGRPAVLIRCPLCDTERKTTEFNRKKTACLQCLSNKSAPSAALLERVYTDADYAAAERIVRSLEAQEAMDRGWKEFQAKFPQPDICSCCQRKEADGEIPDIDPPTLLCGLCWWDVQHCGQCQQCKGRAAIPDPPVYFPHLVGRLVPPMPHELKVKLHLVPPEPGPPLTPEQIAADGEGD